MMRWLWLVLTSALIAAGLAWALSDLARVDSQASTWATLAEHAQTASPGLWLLCLAGWTLGYAIRSERVHAEWHARVGLGRAASLALVCRHYAWVNLLPWRAGEAAFPLLLQREQGVALAASAASLVWWRMQDAAVLALLAFVVLLASPLVAWAGAMVLALLGGVLLWRSAVPALSRALHPEKTAAEPGWRGWLSRQLAQLPAHLAQAGAGPRGWALSLANWSVKIATLGLALALLVGGSWRVGAPAALGGELGAALPGQPLAGFGAYEAGVWALWRLHSAAEPAALVLAAALTVHMANVLGALALGGLAWLAVARKPRRITQPHAAVAPHSCVAPTRKA